MRRFVSLLLLACALWMPSRCGPVWAQVLAPPGFFTVQYATPVSNLYHGAVAVGDFDRRRFGQDFGQDRLDRMDLVMTGLRAPRALDPAENFSFSEVYIHETQLVRSDVGPPTEDRSYNGNFSDFQGLFYSDAAVYDYDNDGDLDLLLLGATDGGAPFAPATVLYRNNGAVDVRFEEVARLAGLYYGSADWGDVDDDGDADLLLTGVAADQTFKTLLYRNDGQEGFAMMDHALDDVGFGDAAWGDYDGDDDLDVLLSGAVGPGRFTSKIFRNDDGVYTDVGAPLPGLSFSQVAWIDADGDGRLDALVTGGFLNPFIMEGETAVFRNLGGDRFQEVDVEGTGAFDGDLAVGDYDGDGDYDFIVSGRQRAAETIRARLYRNDGDAFRVDYSVPEALSAAFALADYNRDGALDVFITGFDPAAGGLAKPQTQFYESGRFNAPPVPPSRLEATVEDQRITLTWDPARDDRTPAAGLTYNVRVGTFPGGSDVLSAMAEADGTRWVSAPGNAGPGTRLRLNLPRGSYYWAVQALDAGYAGSAFAEEQFFTTGDPNDRTPPDPPSALSTAAGDQHVVLAWNANPEPDLSQYRIYRGTSPGAGTFLVSTEAQNNFYLDQDVDLGTTYFYRVTAIDETGNESGFSAEASATPRRVFAQIATPLPAAWRTIHWGDYDRDGDLDLLLPTARRPDQIWRNEGGDFIGILFPGQTFPNLIEGGGAWADVDSDGFLDALLTGLLFSQRLSSVFRFTGQFFERDPNVDLLAVNNAAAAWGDYDNDGDLDLALAGRSAFRDTTIVYRNDADSGSGANTGPFVDLEAGLPPLSNGKVAWVDYDGDLDLDLMLAGGGLLNLYRNNDGVLNDAQIGLGGLTLGDAAWGDYDNDGDLDLAVIGRLTEAQEPAARIYRNDGGDTFTDVGAVLAGGINGAAAWGDYDNDGDLDLALAADGGTEGRFTKIYLNARGTFLDAGIGFEGVDRGALAWGDYDNDGDLDLLVTGRTSLSGAATMLYRNETGRRHAPPSTPTGLSAEVGGTDVLLRWGASTDDATPAPGLTYTLRVGTSPGGVDVFAPMALEDGTPQLAAFGNAFHSTAWRLRNLPPGTYTWSVQARDHGFQGSPFAEEAAFTIGSGKDGTTTDVEDEPPPPPPALEAGYPNPFHDRTTIRYALPAAAEARLAVYDVLGRRVRTLVTGLHRAGEQTVAWDGTGDGGEQAASGIYLLRLEIQGGPVLTRTLTRVR